VLCFKRVYIYYWKMYALGNIRRKQVILLKRTLATGWIYWPFNLPQYVLSDSYKTGTCYRMTVSKMTSVWAKCRWDIHVVTLINFSTVRFLITQFLLQLLSYLLQFKNYSLIVWMFVCFTQVIANNLLVKIVIFHYYKTIIAFQNIKFTETKNVS
jgi:hypothetical protein